MLQYKEVRDLLSKGKVVKSIRENYISYELITMYDGMPVLTNVQRHTGYEPSSVNWTCESTLKLIYKRAVCIKSNMIIVTDRSEIDFILRLIRKSTHGAHNQPHARNYALFAMENDFPSVHDFDLSEITDSLLN